MEKNQIKIVKPFGPSVVIAKIPLNTLEMLNKYIDDIVADKKKSADLDHGNKLVGDVTQEFLLEKEIIEKSGWGKFLVDCVSKWMEIEMKAKMTKFEFIDVCSRHGVNQWVVMDDLLLSGNKHPHDLTVLELNEFMWKTY